MKVQNWFRSVLGLSAITLVFGHAFHTWADEDGDAPKKQRVVVIEADEEEELAAPQRDSGNYWIGIQCEANDSGIVVGEVVEGSPADKAGLKTHDIIESVGGTEIDDVRALIESVQKSRGDKLDVKIMRGDDHLTLTITPEEQPRIQFGDRANRPDMEFGFRDFMNRFNSDDFDFQFLNPGMIVDFNQLGFGDYPENASIKIERKNDEKAIITIERDGKTWTVDEESVDELPPDLRRWAKRALIGMSGKNRKLRGNMAIPKPIPLPKFNLDQFPEHLQKQFGVQRDDDRDKEISDLKAEMKELREMIEELKK